MNVSLMVNIINGGESIVDVKATARDSLDRPVTISDQVSVTYSRPPFDSYDGGFSDSNGEVTQKINEVLTFQCKLQIILITDGISAFEKS